MIVHNKHHVTLFKLFADKADENNEPVLVFKNTYDAFICWGDFDDVEGYLKDFTAECDSLTIISSLLHICIQTIALKSLKITKDTLGPHCLNLFLVTLLLNNIVVKNNIFIFY